VYSGDGISKFSNCSFVDPVNPSLRVVCPSAKYVINYARLGKMNIKHRRVLCLRANYRELAFVLFVLICSIYNSVATSFYSYPGKRR